MASLKAMDDTTLREAFTKASGRVVGITAKVSCCLPMVLGTRGNSSMESLMAKARRLERMELFDKVSGRMADKELLGSDK